MREFCFVFSFVFNRYTRWGVEYCLGWCQVGLGIRGVRLGLGIQVGRELNVIQVWGVLVVFGFFGDCRVVEEGGVQGQGCSFIVGDFLFVFKVGFYYILYLKEGFCDQEFSWFFSEQLVGNGLVRGERFVGYLQIYVVSWFKVGA